MLTQKRKSSDDEAKTGGTKECHRDQNQEE
jgi:hypothetical protein